VSDRRRLGRVNVVCIIVLAFVGGTRGKKRGSGGSGEGHKIGAVDFKHGTSKARSSQPPFQVRGLFKH
jgi:hypothetical protein